MAVEVTHAHRADRALEWNVRDHERGRGTVDAQDGGVVFLVDREHCRNDLDVEPEPVWEQRVQGPVGEPGREDRGLAWPALAAHERAGDLARRAELLLVIAGDRGENDAFRRL